MRSGVRIALDIGRARIGVARSDGAGVLAFPVATVKRDQHDQYLDELSEIIDEYEPLEVLVGLPLNLRGEHTASTDDALSVAKHVGQYVDLPIRMVDERLSTVTASRQLHDVGRAPSRERSRIDQLAAVVILQTALDQEQSSAKPPGYLLSVRE